MAEDIPLWAMRAFCERANLNYDEILVRPWVDGVALRSAVRAGGLVIAQHEQPPVDPLLAEAIELVVSDDVNRTDNQIAAIRARRAGHEKVNLAIRALRRGMELASTPADALGEG